jgi:hypothetical protein
LLINQVMRGEPVNVLNAAVSALATLLIGAALLLVALRLYQREALVFGR